MTRKYKIMLVIKHYKYSKYGRGNMKLVCPLNPCIHYLRYQITLCVYNRTCADRFDQRPVKTIVPIRLRF